MYLGQAVTFLAHFNTLNVNSLNELETVLYIRGGGDKWYENCIIF